MPRRDGGLGTHYYYLLPATPTSCYYYYLLPTTYDNMHMRGAGAPLIFSRESYQLHRPVQFSGP